MEQGFFSTKGNRFLGSLALVMVSLALASFTILNLTEADETQNTATISVEGKGEVMAVPDIGTFSFSVEAEGETAAEAQELSGTKMNAILAYLREQGIEEKDIKTANYNLYPRYTYTERICPVGSYCPPGERVQDGFSVNQTVTVKVRDTEAAGAIIAGVGEREATNISGLNFTIDDEDSLKMEAREKAIANAREKAEVLADQLGVRIVRVVDFYENSGDNYMAYEARAYAMDAAVEEAGFGGAELPTGENTITTNVSVIYEIR